MKSIIQEASSIAKAIEQSRVKAGNPVNFSVKILEEATKNFFGMTTKPAKIAFYFDEKPAPQSSYRGSGHTNTNNSARKPEPQERHERTPHERPAADRSPDRFERTSSPRTTPDKHEQARPETKRPERQEPRRERPEQRQEKSEPTVRTVHNPAKESVPQWNPLMMDAMSAWLHEVLNGLGLKDRAFSIEPNNFYARITFNNHLVDNHDKEKKLLASLALLLLEVTKRKFKVNLRRHKIILTIASDSSSKAAIDNQ